MDLTDAQLDKLANVFVVIGEVLFASVVVPFFVGFGRIDRSLFYSGAILTLFSWFSSVVIVRGVKR